MNHLNRQQNPFRLDFKPLLNISIRILVTPLLNRQPNQDVAHAVDVYIRIIIDTALIVNLVGTDCAALVKPGGVMIAATLNRTAKAFILAILGAEYLLRWLPRVLRDLPYRLFVKLRYRVFGRLDACPIPTPEQASRFLA